MQILWNKEYETGVMDIDREHRQFVDLINGLQAHINTNQVNGIGGIFDSLASYMCRHFVSEESLAANYRVEAALQQRLHSEHQEFLREVGRLRQLRDHNPLEAAYDLHAVLKRWLTEHIMTTDAAVAAALPDTLRQPHHHEAAEAVPMGNIGVLP
ncbi:MAG: bacteriohemerythrin [Candidatus Nitricoxidivorans perseverans]|uniref:Bacteriohemerythrin n=1 Tax=Candidatus Nitricoxidivorans perseverans TaxID=2975601 RepID=A0AA49FK55_9PROT|nr:MAG: bacteriohemerythrin [Candidatus Nitricoxidivorans perseverans]